MLQGKQYNASVDIYLLGLLLYEMLVGQAAFVSSYEAESVVESILGN